MSGEMKKEARMSTLESVSSPTAEMPLATTISMLSTTAIVHRVRGLRPCVAEAQRAKRFFHEWDSVGVAARTSGQS